MRLCSSSEQIPEASKVDTKKKVFSIPSNLELSTNKAWKKRDQSQSQQNKNDMKAYQHGNQRWKTNKSQTFKVTSAKVRATEARDLLSNPEIKQSPTLGNVYKILNIYVQMQSGHLKLTPPELETVMWACQEIAAMGIRKLYKRNINVPDMVEEVYAQLLKAKALTEKSMMQAMNVGAEHGNAEDVTN